MMRYHSLFLTLLIFLPVRTPAQVVQSHRIINVTFDTQAPNGLTINRGRLLWRDTDPGSGTVNLKYYSGAEVITLDSNLTGVTFSLDGDYAAWSTSDEQLKIFDLRSWELSMVGLSYNPGFSQRICVASGMLAYPRRFPGGGSEIVLRRLGSQADTTLRARQWNTDPSLHHGQLAWVSSELEASTDSSDIFFFDGRSTRNISDAAGARCERPVLKDGHVVWLERSPASSQVKVFTGDSILTLAQALNGTERIAGYDASDGIAVAAVVDTVTAQSTIRIFNGETGETTSIAESMQVAGLHVDNGLIVWQAGTGPDSRLKTFDIQTAASEEIVGAAEDPVLDDQGIAWTLGDAVELRVPVTYQRLTTGLVSGWDQTRFKTIDEGTLLWGDFTNSLNARIIASNGTGPTRLTDSLLYKDFLMANDGVMIWREDFNTLWLAAGSAPAIKIIDSLQCENMYTAGGSIGFHGFRLTDPKAVHQAWLYRINTGTLVQLTADTDQTIMNGITLVNGDTACWYRSTSTESMLMFHNGVTTTRLSDSAVGFQFAYTNGRIVWSESRSGVMQIMTYVCATGEKRQITTGSVDCENPVTDGSRIAWFKGEGQSPILVYYEIDSGRESKVAHIAKPVFRWLWMSNGRIAWSGNDEILVYDGNCISRLTNSGDFTPNTDPYVVNEQVMWKQNHPNPTMPRYGDIFIGILHARVAFDAFNVNGPVPLPVSFFNRSWEGPRSYSWDFGDGNTSTVISPIHTYQNPGTYTVTLTAFGLNGVALERKIHLVRAAEAPTGADDGPTTPASFSLFQNFPNPFNPKTTIRFAIPEKAHVMLTVHDMLGREVRILVNEVMERGVWSREFAAEDLASGVYFIRLLSGRLAETKKMLLLR